MPASGNLRTLSTFARGVLCSKRLGHHAAAAAAHAPRVLQAPGLERCRTARHPATVFSSFFAVKRRELALQALLLSLLCAFEGTLSCVSSMQGWLTISQGALPGSFGCLLLPLLLRLGVQLLQRGRTVYVFDALQCLLVVGSVSPCQSVQVSSDGSGSVMFSECCLECIGRAKDTVLEVSIILRISVCLAPDVLLCQTEAALWILAQCIFRCWPQSYPADASRCSAVRYRFFVFFHVLEHPCVDVAVGDDGQVFDPVQVHVVLEVLAADLPAFGDCHLSYEHAGP